MKTWDYAEFFDKPQSWPVPFWTIHRSVFDRDEAQIMREFRKRPEWLVFKRKGIVEFIKGN